jgi:transcription initiation factor IIE alpha subunit
MLVGCDRLARVAGELNGMTINFPCREFTKSFRELKTNTKFVCPQCEQKFDSANFKAEIQKAEKAIDELRRKLGGIGKP